MHSNRPSICHVETVIGEESDSYLCKFPSFRERISKIKRKF